MHYALALALTLSLAPKGASEANPAGYDQRLTGFEYPFQTSTFPLSSQGQALEMVYMHLPPQEGRPTVVLMHGKNFTGAYWEGTARQLQAGGYGVLIPDQIGFGKSSKPTTYQYSFAALAKNTHGLMSHLKISDAIIVGHSMGGMLATRFALMYARDVRALLLVNPIGLEDYLRFVEYKDIEFFYQKELKKTPEKVIAYQKKNYYDGNWKPEYVKHAAPLVGWMRGLDWSTIARVNALTYDMIFTQPVIEEIHALEVPMTLILGTRDRTGPGRGWKRSGVTRALGRYDRLGAEVLVRNPRARLIELEGVGHAPQLEDPARFAPVFMEALEAR